MIVPKIVPKEKIMLETYRLAGRMNALVAAGAVALVFAASVPIQAAGGSSQPATPSVEMTPEEEAIQLYNQGLKARDKAWQLDEAHAATPSDKLAEKIDKQFAKAAKLFEEAVDKNPDFHQAHSSLGYSLRRMGDYERSLEAYNRALELEPGYSEAIEYRAEAYLGLNRVEEAKAAYLELFRSDRERADELYEAMSTWLAKRKSDPAGIDSATLDGFTSWLAERGQVADTTAMLYTTDQQIW